MSIAAFIKKYGPMSLAGAVGFEIAHHMPSSRLAIAVWGGALALSIIVWFVLVYKFHRQHLTNRRTV